MIDVLADIWLSLPVLSSILEDWPPYSLFAMSSWNRYKFRIVSCIAELLQMLGLVFLELFVQLSTLLIFPKFLPAPGFYMGRVPVPGYLSLIDSCAWASLLLHWTQLSTTHRRPISLIHFPSLMPLMICWAIGRMIALSFEWMRGICFGSFFWPWSLLFGLLGLAPKGLDSSTVADWLCTISTHDRSCMLLPNALYSSTLAFRPCHHWKNSMWWCGQVLHFWYHQVIHHPSDLCVCVPQIESVILLFFEYILETNRLLS